MKTVSQEKTHYKMYKAGKYWLFSLITVSSFIRDALRPLHTVAVQADDAGQSSSSLNSITTNANKIYAGQVLKLTSTASSSKTSSNSVKSSTSASYTIKW